VDLTLPAWSRTTKCANTCTTRRHAASCNHTHLINGVTPDMLVHARTKVELSALSPHVTQGAHQSVLIRNFIPECTNCCRLCHYVCTFGLIVGKGTYRIQIVVFWDVMDHNFVLASKFWKNLLHPSSLLCCVDGGSRFLQSDGNHVLNMQCYIPEDLM